jgi:hypothetical protein
LQDEKKVGLIPRLIVQGKLGPKEYAVLVTDKRSIFVLEINSKAGLGAAFGVVGAMAAAAATSRRTFDYEKEDPDLLATDPKNFAIPHHALERLEMKKGIIGSTVKFKIEYRTADRKNKTVKGQLAPPISLSKQKKQEGQRKEIVCLDYAKNVQDVYQKALPAVAFTELADWKL